MRAMRYLTFDVSDNADGVVTIEAMASTPNETHAAAVAAEAEQLIAWGRQHFPDGHGPIEEGFDWDHDLQQHVEDGQWHTLVLTVSASPRFAEAFLTALCAKGH